MESYEKKKDAVCKALEVLLEMEVSIIKAEGAVRILQAELQMHERLVKLLEAELLAVWQPGYCPDDIKIDQAKDDKLTESTD